MRAAAVAREVQVWDLLQITLVSIPDMVYVLNRMMLDSRSSWCVCLWVCLSVCLCVCLCSAVDVSAAENIGRVLAQRCLQCGITCMRLAPFGNTPQSEKVRWCPTQLSDIIYQFTSAFIAASIRQVTTSSSTECSCRRQLSAGFINGYDSTKWFTICGWPHVHLSDIAILCSCILATRCIAVAWHRSCVPSWRMYAGYRRWPLSSAVCWQSNMLGQEITQPVRWPLCCNCRANTVEQSAWTASATRHHLWTIQTIVENGPLVLSGVSSAWTTTGRGSQSNLQTLTAWLDVTFV